MVIDEVITMLDIKLHKRAAFKHMINKTAQLSITPEVKLEEWKKVALMAENNGCNIRKTANREKKKKTREVRINSNTNGQSSLTSITT
jgi:hypothetical protein